MCLSVSSPPAHVTAQSPQVCTVLLAPTITTWITNPPLGIYGLTGTQEKLHRGSPGSAQDARTWPLWRGSARPVGTVYTLSQVPTHVPNPHPFPRSYRCKCFSPQTGRSWFCPRSSAPKPWRVPVCHFHTKGCKVSGWCDAQILPLRHMCGSPARSASEPACLLR